MTNPFADQAAFMTAAGQTTNHYNQEQTELYVNLMVEEFQECVSAVSLEGYIKELTDLIVVTIGCLHSLGVDAEQAWQLVHASNMSKLPFTKREDGKVQKGPNYQPPNLVPLVATIEGLTDEDLIKTEAEIDELPV
jgi:predicted HAD superfamily Cof-like phosphohydrolase